jgi:hypothetical protein
MTYQTQSNAWVATKVQSALGTQASGSGATILRTAGGQYGRLTKQAIESNEIRRDGMMSRGRHGSQRTAGSYTSELSLGLMDPIIEAVMRGTWSTADLALDADDVTSTTTTASTLVATSGSWISLGLRVGDVIRISGATTAANNGRNLRITGLTATTITVAETLTLDATPDTGTTITRTGRSVSNGTTKRYFTVEEHELDIDGSEIFTDCMWGSLKLSMAPNGLITIEPSWVGTGQFETKTGDDAPFFTDPTEPTGVPMAALDAVLRFGDTDMVDLTSFDITMDITPNAPDVVASKYAPDVFPGLMAVSMNLTMLRSDLAEVTKFSDETVCSLQLLAIDNEDAPQDFVSLFVGNFALGSVDKSALSKQGGPRTQTISVPTALVGKDNTGGAFDGTMCRWQVSNAS